MAMRWHPPLFGSKVGGNCGNFTRTNELVTQLLGVQSRFCVLFLQILFGVVFVSTFCLDLTFGNGWQH